MKKILYSFWCVPAILLIAMTGGERELGRLARRDSVTPSPTLLNINADFGKMPLYFVANEGQMDEQVAYYVQGKDKTLYFTAEGMTISLIKAKQNEQNPSIRELEPRDQKSPSDEKGPWGKRIRQDQTMDRAPTERWAVKLDFVGANPAVKPNGMNKTGAVISYFKGKPEDWHTGLATYSKVVYENLWPGIDLVYSGDMNRLKYEFLVHPGADPSQIRLAYRGAEKVYVDNQGCLQVSTPIGEFSDDKPTAYQEVKGKRVNVPLSYELRNDRSDESSEIDLPEAISSSELGRSPISEIDGYGFEIDAYDKTQLLIIDPALLIYCGYIGGIPEDKSYGVAVDGSGNVYVTGLTESTEATFPATVGPDLNHNGDDDVFVAKVNSSGTALVYCGYIGGSGVDRGSSIDIDGSGNAYLTGSTGSSEATFPVTVGPDLTFNSGLIDAFVAKINSSGTALVYCGYIGGLDFDWGIGIAVDGSGNAYVTGFAGSTEATFPVTVGPDLTYNGDNGDAFVAKVNAPGTALAYCGYIGGSSMEYVQDIIVDGSGNAYVTGSTESTEATFPVTVGPDLTFNSGSNDAFVAKINSSGTALVYCGYIGGSSGDTGYGIAVDGSGNAYLTGSTGSSEATFPVTVGPDLTHNGTSDGFVAKVNSSGTALAYCGYIGGSSGDAGRGIVVDGSRNAYVTGFAYSTEATFPVTGGPDLTHNGTCDAFVAKISAYEPPPPIFDGHDYDGNSTSDISIFRPSNGVWYISGQSDTQWGTPGDIPVPGNYDLDAATEIAVFRPADGVWYINGISATQWGAEGDIPVPHKYSGGFKTDLAVWRPSNGVWYIVDVGIFQWGQEGDYPVPGDYNGDGADEIAVWRPANGEWFVYGGGYAQWGAEGDVPVPADYDGDGMTDIAVFRPTSGMWYIQYSGGGTAAVQWGTPSDTPVPGDYDGNGTADVVIWRPMDGLWYINGGAITQYGMVGDIPLVR